MKALGYRSPGGVVTLMDHLKFRQKRYVFQPGVLKGKGWEFQWLKRIGKTVIQFRHYKVAF